MMARSSGSHARAILVGFAVGDAIASPYEPWSIAPAPATLAHALQGQKVLVATGLTVQLCESVRSLARDGGEPRHLWSDLGAAYRSASHLLHPRAVVDQFGAAAAPGRRTDATDGSAVVRAVAAGLVTGSLEEAFRCGVDQAAVTHASPLVLDAAGVIAVAAWGRARGLWGSELAKLMVEAPAVSAEVQDVLVVLGGGSADASLRPRSDVVEAVAVLERALEGVLAENALEALTRAARRTGRSAMGVGLAMALAPPMPVRELGRLADRLEDGRQVARAVDALSAP